MRKLLPPFDVTVNMSWAGGWFRWLRVEWEVLVDGVVLKVLLGRRWRRFFRGIEV